MPPPAEVIEAIPAGDVATLRTWLTSGTRDVNEVFDVFEADDITSGTLLHHAVDTYADTVLAKQCAMVQLLLENGADVHAVDHDGGHPLLFAGNHYVSAMLLDNGANINAWDNGGMTALIAAITGEYDDDDEVRIMFEHVRFLVSRGANLLPLLTSPRWINKRSQLPRISDFINTVRAAGSWRNYIRAPRVELVVLRALCARGRAAPPAVTLRHYQEAIIFERLFGAPVSSSLSAKRTKPPVAALPKEVFWHVLSFWRTTRDDEGTFPKWEHLCQWEPSDS
jgi:ankyrin repeat protein